MNQLLVQFGQDLADDFGHLLRRKRIITPLCFCHQVLPAVDGARAKRFASAANDPSHSAIGTYSENVARARTTSDVFNAITEAHRREVLDSLISGEKAVGTIASDLSMPQPQVSEHSVRWGW